MIDDKDEDLSRLEQAYYPNERRMGIELFQRKYPSLFPSWSLSDETLVIFALAPSTAYQAGGSESYFKYVEKAHVPLLKYWQTTETTPPHKLFATGMKLTALVKSGEYGDSSVNDMWLYFASLRNDTRSLEKSLDGRSVVIIKSQAIDVDIDAETDPDYHAVFEFTNEVVLARLLNTLVTGFTYTVTPHFTTFLGTFACNEIEDISGTIHPTRKRIYAIYEQATVSLGKHFDALIAPDMYVVGAIIFQLLAALEAGARLLGLAHNDLHLGNVMLRKVEQTTYAGRTWAYKRQGQPDYYFLQPRHHQDLLVEVIDLGRATLLSRHFTMERVAQRFADDVWDVLDGVRMHAEVWAQKNSTWTKVVPLLRAVSARIGDNGTLRDKEAFLHHWPESELELWFKPFRVAPKASVVPLLISLVPQGNLVTAQKATARELDAVLPTLQALWEPRGIKRTNPYAACATCLDPWTTHKTEVGDATRFFCGHGCYQVYYGGYHHT